MPSTTTAQRDEVDLGDAPERDLARLRPVNAVLALLHALQAVAVLLLANDVALPVTASYLSGPPGGQVGDPVVLGDIRVAWGVAAFLLVSALAHTLVAGPLFARYTTQLRHGMNRYRWYEYSISASVMIVLIAQLAGVSDVAALLGLFGVNASMIFFGWVQERYEHPGSGGWLPFVLGCVVGIVPWLAIGVYLVQPGSASATGPPAFVYGIFISLFLFFNAFAVNQWLQYRRAGRWRSYLFGEQAYAVLSLTAKSALAWQVFGGTLAG